VQIAYLIDTNIIIDYLRGNLKAISFLEEALDQSTCYVSVITLAELYVGVRDSREQEILANFLSLFRSIAVDESTAIAGGLYRRQYGKSHGVCIADSLIAATADQLRATLVTLNKKHFPMLRDIFSPY